MRIYRLIFLRELRKVFSYKANYIFSLMFYCSIIFLISVGLQGQNNILSNIAPSLIWISIVLVLFLTFDDIFYDDYYDGTLDIYLIENITLYGSLYDLNIIKDLEDSLEKWNYDKLNETDKISRYIKEQLKIYDFS